MIIFEGVPVWLQPQLTWMLHYHNLTINLQLMSVDILLPHQVYSGLNLLLSVLKQAIRELRAVR